MAEKDMDTMAEKDMDKALGIPPPCTFDHHGTYHMEEDQCYMVADDGGVGDHDDAVWQCDIWLSLSSLYS